MSIGYHPQWYSKLVPKECEFWEMWILKNVSCKKVNFEKCELGKIANFEKCEIQKVNFGKCEFWKNVNFGIKMNCEENVNCEKCEFF